MRIDIGPVTPAAHASDAASLAQFAADVQYYLTQSPRQLPSRYLYDELGSALFDAICSLPWYPITRAESRLLAARAAEVFVLQPFSTVVELGPGSGEKIRLLIEAGRIRSGARRGDQRRRRGRPDARAVSRIEHRQLRSARRRRVSPHASRQHG
jgi:hypothetical protein